ncbi:hypothetical protein [Neisseria yangbaofengii]|uniref:hypothetical protein n=1 Tax=Neisseria yangbaofengii TaxID=2709396 RepID=UPI0013EB133A|nr:hypothetical protein [Neisseria yangbaofengii]
MFFPIVVFLLTPSHAVSPVENQVAVFVDEYLFGQGYYKPEAYPFAAKLTNSFSFVFAAAAAFIAAFSQGWKKYDFSQTDPLLLVLVMLPLTIFSIWLTVEPMEFSKSTSRSWGTSESFHNTVFLYLFAMVCKNTTIYLGIRFILAFSSTFLLEWKEYREENTINGLYEKPA